MCLLCTAYVDTGHAPRRITLVFPFSKFYKVLVSMFLIRWKNCLCMHTVVAFLCTHKACKSSGRWIWVWCSRHGSNSTQRENAGEPVNNQQHFFFFSYWLLLRWGWSKTSQRRHCLALRSSLVSRGTPRSPIPTTEVSCLKREIFHGRVWFECLGVVFLNEWTVLLPIVSTSPHPHINCGKSFSFGLVLFQETL